MIDLLVKFLKDLENIRDKIFVKEIICGKFLTISNIEIISKEYKSVNLYSKSNYLKNSYLKKRYTSYGLSSSMFDDKDDENKFKNVIQFKNIEFNKLLHQLDLKIFYHRAIIISIINAISSLIVFPFVRFENSNLDEIKNMKLINENLVIDKNIVIEKLLFDFFPKMKRWKKEQYNKLILSLSSFKVSNSVADINYSGKKIAMVGYFRPVAAFIGKDVYEIGVIDFDDDNLKEAKKEGYIIISDYKKLNNYDIVIVSGTSIINNTLSYLLRIINISSIVIMGPTVPIFPYFYISNNIKVHSIAGRIVFDYNKTKEIVIKNGTTKSLKDFTLKVKTNLFGIS